MKILLNEFAIPKEKRNVKLFMKTNVKPCKSKIVQLHIKPSLTKKPNVTMSTLENARKNGKRKMVPKSGYLKPRNVSIW